MVPLLANHQPVPFLPAGMAGIVPVMSPAADRRGAVLCVRGPRVCGVAVAVQPNSDILPNKARERRREREMIESSVCECVKKINNFPRHQCMACAGSSNNPHKLPHRAIVIDWLMLLTACFTNGNRPPLPFENCCAVRGGQHGGFCSCE